MRNQLNEIYELIQEQKQEQKLSTEIQRAKLVGNVCEEVAKYSRAQNDSERACVLCRIAIFMISAIKKHPLAWNVCTGVVATSIIEDAIKYGIDDSVLIVLATRVYLAIDKLGYNPYARISESIKETL